MAELEFSVAVQIYKFKNIELFKQGIYQIRLRVVYEHNSLTHFAEPVQLIANSEKEDKKNSYKVIPAHILDEFSCFNTRIMLVRYQEEGIVLDEGCEFRFSVPIGDEFNLKILADLYFTNLEHDNKKKEIFRKLNDNPVISCISSKEFIVKRPNSPISAYLPLSFDPMFFCIAESVVHIYPRQYIFAYPIKNFFKTPKIVGGSASNKMYSTWVSPLFLAYTHIRSVIADLLPSSPEINILPEAISLPINSPSCSTFHESLQTHDPLQISESIHDELNSLSYILTSTLSLLEQLTSLNGFKSLFYYRQKFNQEACQHFQEFVKLKSFHKEPKIEYEPYDKSVKIRKEDYYKNLERLHIQAQDLYFALNHHPIFVFNTDESHFQQIIETSFVKSADIHVIFLVHGYRGSSVDMHMIKGYLNIIYPFTHVYSCRSNENFTDCNIENLGQNLAQEVIHFIMESKAPRYRLRITFIGHSLGGLIIRAALKHLGDFKSCMHSYISLSSPHIGIFYSQNILLQFGKWALKKMQDSTSFSQMTLKDSKNKRETFIYKLSESEGLNWFKHVIFFTCEDDPYVPVDSAGIYIPPKSVGSKHESIFLEIVQNLIKKIGKDRLVRIDVSFKYDEIMDWCILCGNRHIDFLDNPCFIKMLFYSMPKIFS